jgi:hypothetical protein
MSWCNYIRSIPQTRKKEEIEAVRVQYMNVRVYFSSPDISWIYFPTFHVLWSCTAVSPSHTHSTVLNEASLASWVYIRNSHLTPHKIIVSIMIYQISYRMGTIKSVSIASDDRNKCALSAPVKWRGSVASAVSKTITSFRRSISC